MKRSLLLLSIVLLLLHCQPKSPITDFKDMDVNELTISQIHEAYRRGTFTAEQLVLAYLERINTFDQPENINAIVLINPVALETARALDQEYKETGVLRPLHGVPVIVKDNYNTKGLQTTAGSVVLEGFEPAENAWQVQKMVEAGAIILAKSNMAEWAFSPRHTASSLGGITYNPYKAGYVPAGSSGGTAAAVAANFGAVGLGTDTGNSIRGPSSHNALVGFRSTLGLTSRYGIVPLYLRNDVGGPMCRTVEDATRILEVIAGKDPNDPITQYSEGRIPDSYRQFLQKDGLKGARIGVFRQLSDNDIHPEIKVLFDQALMDLDSLGATVVDSVFVEGFDSLRQNQWCSVFRTDVENYLATFVQSDSLQTLEDIIRISSDRLPEDVRSSLEYFQGITAPDPTDTTCTDPYHDKRRIAFRKAIEDEMDRLQLDAIIYPSWNYPPAKEVNYAEDYKGDNSQVIAPHTGQPAFTVPMGFTNDGLPTGLQFVGRMFAEPTLIKLTYGYEQGTLHRRPPTMPHNQ